MSNVGSPPHVRNAMADTDPPVPRRISTAGRFATSIFASEPADPRERGTIGSCPLTAELLAVLRGWLELA